MGMRSIVIRLQETVKYIEEGKRLQRPEKAEIHIYDTMTWCWEYKPQARPSFAELFQVFCENPEYENLKELLKSQDLQQLGMWYCVYSVNEFIPLYST